MITQKIPGKIIETLEAEMAGLSFGCVTLKVQLHDGKQRFVISREKSIVLEKPTSGAEAGR
jgi:hypothetical protein